ncbi:Fatty acid amide hydrolase 1 [Taenia crassiceps]|uniref:Fatty acid amide hydrolase 1 n=1 Tax=Taenia crassiceps TaxID=6207 RepID=A0ABR4QSM0_9CEST
MNMTDSSSEDFIAGFIAACKRVRSWEVFGSIILIYFTFHLFQRILMRRKFRRVLTEKQELLQEARARLIDRVQADPPPSTLKDLSALEVHDLLQFQEITPFEALRVYQKKVVNVLDSNCICDVIEEAEATAKSIDSNFHSPLRGLPVSVKENIAVGGYDASIGLVSRLLKPVKSDGVLIQVIRSVGAVPFVTTTMSPTGYCLDGSTKIFGKQRNPHDTKRLAGGSSSGEAILIAKGASPLGFGTDIAGSVRLPAAFCGICALKPTTRRVSTMGVESVSQTGCVGLHPVFGPMSGHTRLLTDAMRAVLTSVMFGLDPRTPPLPFHEGVFTSNKPLVIGFYTNLGGDIAIKIVPSVESALSRAKAGLQAKGHTLVDFQIPDPNKLVCLSMKCMLGDGGVALCEAARCEPANPRLRRTQFLLGLPAPLRRTAGWFVSTFFSKSIGAVINASTGCRTATEVFTVSKEVEKYQEEFAKAWAAAKLDVLLCPAFPFPAPLEDTPDVLIAGAVTFTSIYNLLDYPSGVVPVSKVSEGDVEAARKLENEYRKGGDWLNATHAKLQSDTKGLPVVVQVVGKPFDEETVLRVMREIEESLPPQ